MVSGSEANRQSHGGIYGKKSTGNACCHDVYEGKLKDLNDRRIIIGKGDAMFDEIKDIQIFQGISEESIEKLRKIPIRKKEVKSNEMVMEKGDALKDLLVVRRGCLKTSEYMINGKEIVSSYYQETDAFPMYLFYGGTKTIPYDVYAFRKSLIYFLPMAALNEVVEKDVVFLKNVLRFVAEYTCYNKLLIRATQYLKINQRLAYYLVHSDEIQPFKMPKTQEMLADILQVTRSSLNQELKKLEAEGIIHVQGSNIEVLDNGYLKNLI